MERARPPHAARGIARALLGALVLVLAGCGEGPGRGQGPRRPGGEGGPFSIVYVGSGYWRSPEPHAIHVFRLDLVSGRLTEIQRVEAPPSPSFFVINPGRRFLYVNVENEHSGVAAYAIDPRTGELHFLNQLVTDGRRSAYLTMDSHGRFLLAANYDGNSVAVISLHEDGSLGEVVDTEEQGPDAYPHCVRLDPSDRYAFVMNRSGDTITQYRFDARSGQLEPNDPFVLAFPDRTGPRHMETSRDGRLAWVINETDSSVTTLALDPDTGTLSPRGRVSTLPEGFAARNNPADLRLHPVGRFLFGANRGHGSIASFEVDSSTGALRAVDHVHVAGKGPRNLVVEESGNFVIAGVLDTGRLQVFRVALDRGTLAPVGEPIAVPSPSGIAAMTLPPIDPNAPASPAPGLRAPR